MEGCKVKGYEIVDTNLEVYPDKNDEGDTGLIIQINNVLKDANDELHVTGLALFLKESYVHALDDALFDVGEDRRAILTTPTGASLTVSKKSIVIYSPTSGAVIHDFEKPVCVSILEDGHGLDLNEEVTRSGEFLQFKALISAYVEVSPKKYMEYELDMLQMRDLMPVHEEETVTE